MIDELIFLCTAHRISVTFVYVDGSEKTICVPVGMSMLEAAHRNDIELEGAYFSWKCAIPFQCGYCVYGSVVNSCLVIRIWIIFYIKNKLVMFNHLAPWFYHFSSKYIRYLNRAFYVLMFNRLALWFYHSSSIH
jgi:hypothetical protein